MSTEIDDDVDYSWMLEAEEGVQPLNEVEKDLNTIQTDIPKSDQETNDITVSNASTIDLETDKSLSVKDITNVTELKEIMSKNKEVLRKLKLVKTHQQKDNLKTLNGLILKWRKASQTAVKELLKYAPKEPPTTISQIIQHLAIDPNIIKFDAKAQTFTELVKNNKTNKDDT